MSRKLMAATLPPFKMLYLSIRICGTSKNFNGSVGTRLLRDEQTYTNWGLHERGTLKGKPGPVNITQNNPDILK